MVLPDDFVPGQVITSAAMNAIKAEVEAAGARRQRALAPARPAPPLIRRQARRVITINPGADGWTLAGQGAASAVSDTTGKLFGAACAKIVTDGAGTEATLSITGLTAFDLNTHDMEVLLQVDDTTKLNAATGVMAYAGNNALVNRHSQYVVATEQGPSALSGEWTRIRLPMTALTPGTSGPPFRNALTDLRIGVKDAGAGAATVRVQEVSLIPKHPAFAVGGLVTLTFDDSLLSQMTNAVPAMAAKGFQATFHPILDTLGDSSHLSLAQLKVLRDLGHEVAAHAATTANHNAGFTTLSAPALEAEMLTMKEWARENGFTSESFAYPRGLFDLAVVEAARRYFHNAVTTTARPNETLPPQDVMRMRRVSLDASWAIATIKTEIDNAMLRGAWLNLCFHDVSDTPIHSSNVTPAVFTQIMDYLALRGVPVMTTQDALTAFATDPNVEGVSLGLRSVGEETFPLPAPASVSLASGTIRFAYFTARKTEAVANLATMTASTAAAGLTLARMGLYEVDATGNLTLIASTANDTALWAGTGIRYQRPTTATAYKVRGRRYAFATLIVGTVGPALASTAVIGSGTEYATDPLSGSLLSGQTDLPATVLSTAVTSNGIKTYGVVLP